MPAAAFTQGHGIDLQQSNVSIISSSTSLQRLQRSGHLLSHPHLQLKGSNKGRIPDSPERIFVPPTGAFPAVAWFWLPPAGYP